MNIYKSCAPIRPRCALTTVRSDIYNIIFTLTDRRDLLSSARTVNYKTWPRVSLSPSPTPSLVNPSITKVAWILINCFFLRLLLLFIPFFVYFILIIYVYNVAVVVYCPARLYIILYIYIYCELDNRAILNTHMHTCTNAHMYMHARTLNEDYTI